jgi:hypothetical protein
MAIIQSLLIKDKVYDNNRLTIVGSQSGDLYYYYSESRGTRNYINQLSSTASNLESVSFNAYLSFTSSGTQSWDFSLIPMSSGESCMIETRAFAMNQDGSRAFAMKSFGAFRHNGSELSILGNSFDYDIKTDMYNVDVEFYANGTASVNMDLIGESGETLDWDIYIVYTKSYHSLTTGEGGGSDRPWYPPVPPARS